MKGQRVLDIAFIRPFIIAAICFPSSDNFEESGGKAWLIGVIFWHGFRGFHGFLSILSSISAT